MSDSDRSIGMPYDGRNCEFLLLGIFEKVEDIIPNNNTRLAGQDALGHG